MADEANGRTSRPSPTTVRQATMELFRSHGLTTWFGNPGSSELTLLQDFPDDFRYVLGLQEMIPVGMADGYAQITRRPAMVNLHTAPGMGNALGALYNAFVNKTPLIVTAGNQRRTMQNQYCLLTNVDPTTVPRPFVKWAAEPAIASEAPAVSRPCHPLGDRPRRWGRCSSRCRWTTWRSNSTTPSPPTSPSCATATSPVPSAFPQISPSRSADGSRPQSHRP